MIFVFRSRPHVPKHVRALTHTASGARKRTGPKASAPLASASGGQVTKT